MEKQDIKVMFGFENIKVTMKVTSFVLALFLAWIFIGIAVERFKKRHA